MLERPNTRAYKLREDRQQHKLLFKETLGTHLSPKNAIELYDSIIQGACVRLKARDFVGARILLFRARSLHRLKYYPTSSQRIVLINILVEVIRDYEDADCCRLFKEALDTFLRGKKGLYLDVDDMTLDWKKLFNIVLRKQTNRLSDFIPEKGLDAKDIDVDLAEVIQTFTPAEEIPEILDRCLAQFDLSENCGAATTASLLFLFFPTLPPRKNLDLQPQYYLPTLFKVWSYVQNSRSYDVSFISLMSRLARDQIEEPSRAPFKNFGIFTTDQFRFIVSKAIRFFKIPVMGQVRHYADQLASKMFTQQVVLEKDFSMLVVLYSRLIIYSLSPACASSDDNVLSDLERFLLSVRNNLHPSNSTRSTRMLTELLLFLAYDFCSRWNSEKQNAINVTKARKLNENVRARFVRIVRNSALLPMYNNSHDIRSIATKCLGVLASLEPDLILPAALKRIYPSLKGVLETVRTQAAMALLINLIPRLLTSVRYRAHILPLLELCLPGIDPNDLQKTDFALEIFKTCFQLMPITHLDDIADITLAQEWFIHDLEMLNDLKDQEDFSEIKLESDQSFQEHVTDEILTSVAISASAMFNELCDSFLERLQNLFENLSDDDAEEISSNVIQALIHLFSNCSTDIAVRSARKLISMVEDGSWSLLPLICVIIKAMMVKKSAFIHTLLPQVIETIMSEIANNQAGSDRYSTAENVLPRDKLLIFNMRILMAMSEAVGDPLTEFQPRILDLISVMSENLMGYALDISNNIVSFLTDSLTQIYTLDRRFTTEKITCSTAMLLKWGKTEDASEIDWHIPSDEEHSFALKIFRQQSKLLKTDLNELLERISGSGEASMNLEISLSKRYQQLGWLVFSACMLVRPESLDKRDDYADLTPKEERDFLSEYYFAKCDSGTTLTKGATRVGPTSPSLFLSKEEIDEIGQLLLAHYEKVMRYLPDALQCSMMLLKSIQQWLEVRQYSHILFPLDDYDDCEKEKRKFEIPGLAKTKPRSVSVLCVMKYMMLRIWHSEPLRRLTTLQKDLLDCLFKSVISPFSVIREQAQRSLQSCINVFSGLQLYIMHRSVEYLQMDTKESLMGALHLNGDLIPDIMVNEFLRENFISALFSAQRFDESSLMPYAAGLISIMAVTSYKFSQKTSYNGETLQMIELSEELEAEARDLFDDVRKLYSRNLDKATEYQLKLVKESSDEHWRVSLFMLSFAALSGNVDERLPSAELVQKLAEKTIDEQPSLRTVGITLISAIIPLLYIKTRFSTLEEAMRTPLLMEGEKIVEISEPPYKFEFQNLFTSDNRREFYDDTFCGWLVWPRTRRVFDVLQETWPEKHIDRTRDLFVVMGEFFNLDNFKKIVEYISEEPRNSESSNFRIRKQILQFFRSIWVLESYCDSSVCCTNMESIVRELFTDDKKFRHRVGVEILSSLIIAHKYKPKIDRDQMNEWLVPLVEDILGRKLNPENLPFWKSFMRLIFISSDMARNLGIYSIAKDIRLDLRSDEAFKQASRLSLFRKVRSACDWLAPKEPELMTMIIANFESPYKKVRHEIGLLLTSFLKAELLPPFSNSKEMIEQLRNSTQRVYSERYSIDQDYFACLDEIFAKVEQKRIYRSKDEKSMRLYITISKTFISLVESVISELESLLIIEIYGERIFEELMFMIDIKSDLELREQAASLLSNIASMDMPIEVYDRVILRIRDIALSQEHWNHKLHSISALMQLMWTQLLYLDAVHTERILEIVKILLHDERIEVRHAAVMVLTSLIQCAQLDRDKLIKECINTFAAQLEHTKPPPRERMSKPAALEVMNGNELAPHDASKFKEHLHSEQANMNAHADIGTNSSSGDSPADTSRTSTSESDVGYLPDEIVNGVVTPIDTAGETAHLAINPAKDLPEDTTGKPKTIPAGNAINMENGDTGMMPWSSAILKRHAAILGLSGVLSSCPYDSPPWWMAQVITLLSESVYEVNPIGLSAKKALEKFRKLRSDTWSYDQKFFTTEQLENLAGITSHNYFT